VVAAFASVWLAAGVGSYRALFMSDGVFPAVLAWSFAWMSSKIRHNPPLGRFSISLHTFSLEVSLPFLSHTNTLFFLNIYLQ